MTSRVAGLRIVASRRLRSARRTAAELGVQARLAPSVAVGRGVTGLGHVEFEGPASVADGCWFQGQVAIGAHTTLNRHCFVAGPATIGRYVQLGPRVTVWATNHPLDTVTPYTAGRLFGGALKGKVGAEAVTIGSGCWLASGATILPGTTIGRGAVVAASAVVTADVEPYAIVAGNPARLVRHRLPDEVRSAVERSRWWEREPAELAEHRALFELRFDGAGVDVLAELTAAVDRLGPPGADRR